MLARLPAFTGLPADGAPASGGWRRKLVGAIDKLRLALEDRAHHHPLAWVYTVLNWTVKMGGGMALVAAAAGIGWEPAWAGMVGVEIVSILPVQGPAGFGTFEVRERAARTGRNPQTGEEIQIAASKAPAFKAGSKLKERVSS